MLFSLFTSFIDQYSFLNVFKYLTFRTGLSVVTSLVVVFIIGAPLIKMFSTNMISGPIRQDGPIDHIIKKSGTPTMGGVIIIIVRPHGNYCSFSQSKGETNLNKYNHIHIIIFSPCPKTYPPVHQSAGPGVSTQWRGDSVHNNTRSLSYHPHCHCHCHPHCHKVSNQYHFQNIFCLLKFVNGVSKKCQNCDALCFQLPQLTLCY